MSVRVAPGRFPRRWVLVGVVVLSAGALVWWQRARSGPPAPVAAAEPNTPWLEGDRVRYSEAFAEREGLTVEPAREVVLTPALQVTGTVGWDARRVAAVGARIEGRVHVLTRIVGEDVRAGEVVAELESAELGRAQAEVLKARAHEQAARADELRERTLADAKIAPERDAQWAKATAEAATAARQAAERSLAALGGVVDGAPGLVALRSPLAGRVVEVQVKRGETVAARDTLLVVADLSRVWVELAVFERDLAALREGDRVELRVPSDPSFRGEGRVAHVGESIDPERHAATVRVELENPGRRLRAGQSVVATVHVSGPKEPQVVVPRAALTRVDGRPTVFIRVAEGTVQHRHVTLGAEDAEQVAVLAGVKPGEAVVTRGVLALKAELFR